MAGPNILYLHSHDTGRYVQPYGYPVPTPNIQHLADQGVLFRQAFCAAPVCSGSRAALLTGQCPHVTGMLGLAHRGYRLRHPERHIVHVLRDAGYWSGLIGEQHVSSDPTRRRVRPRRRRREQPGARRRSRRNRAHRRAGIGRRAVLLVGRILRDAPGVLRARLAARRSLLAAAGEHRRHAADAARHGRRSRPAHGRSTMASARCSMRSRRTGSPTTRS